MSWYPGKLVKRLLGQKEETLDVLLEPTMTLEEATEKIKESVEKMDCEQLYRAVDEARTVRDSVFEPSLHFMLTGFLHHAQAKLCKECPEHYQRLIEKYRRKYL